MHEVFKEFTFDSAHRLPYVPTGHKCGRLHGHTYHVTIYVRGPLQREKEWVIDYADIAAAWEPLNEQLDHRYLNEVPGLENSTSENLARWIFERLNLPGLHRVFVRETCTAGCTYFGKPDYTAGA